MMKQLALTPPMGWNSWNTFSCDIDEKIIKETADAMVKEGYLEAGYDTLTLDDGWMKFERDANGRFQPDPAKFPKGMKDIGDYLHSLGLKFGIYSCAGTLTCAGLPGSYGHERVDAESFAEWGVDYVKYDYCFAPQGGTKDKVMFRRMGQALRETGRPIVYSACWGTQGVWEWAKTAGAHLWRLTGDINDSWESIKNVGFGDLGLEGYAGPGGWNDPDMLVVGINGKGYVGKIGGGATMAEYKSHFTLWSILAAPLIMGHDLRDASEEVKNILLNKEVIAVDQDPLGVQGFKVDGWKDVIAKPLADGSIALALFNNTDSRYFFASSFEELGWEATDTIEVRDLWEHKDLGTFQSNVTFPIESHDCMLVKLTRK